MPSMEPDAPPPVAAARRTGALVALAGAVVVFVAALLPASSGPFKYVNFSNVHKLQTFFDIVWHWGWALASAGLALRLLSKPSARFAPAVLRGLGIAMMANYLGDLARDIPQVSDLGVGANQVAAAAGSLLVIAGAAVADRPQEAPDRGSRAGILIAIAGAALVLAGTVVSSGGEFPFKYVDFSLEGRIVYSELVRAWIPPLVVIAAAAALAGGRAGAARAAGWAVGAGLGMLLVYAAVLGNRISIAIPNVGAGPNHVLTIAGAALAVIGGAAMAAPPKPAAA